MQIFYTPTMICQTLVLLRVRVKVLRWNAGWRLEIAPTAAKPTFVGWVLNLRRQVLLLLLRLAVAGLQKLDGHPAWIMGLTKSPDILESREETPLDDYIK